MLYNKKIFERCFSYKGRYWYRNIKHIPLYFKLMRHLIKYGYDEFATWETFNWFIDTMKSILPRYHEHSGVPIVVDNYPWSEETEEDKRIVEQNKAKWRSIIDKMLELLDLMDERNPRYDDMSYKEEEETRNAAKDEFFQLFSEHFYRLWD